MKNPRDGNDISGLYIRGQKLEKHHLYHPFYQPIFTINRQFNPPHDWLEYRGAIARYSKIYFGRRTAHLELGLFIISGRDLSS